MLYYVPDDVRYIIYDVVSTGDYQSLIDASLLIYSWPDLDYVETVGEIFGYGRAELHLNKGHVCEPGRVYVIVLVQWSEKALFTVYNKVHGMSDLRVG